MKSLPDRHLRLIGLLFLVAASVGGLLFVWLSRPAPLANAQTVNTIINDSSTPVVGGWQDGAAANNPNAQGSQIYRLWAFKQFGTDIDWRRPKQSYVNRVYCSWQRNTVYDSSGNIINIGSITINGLSSSTIEAIDSSDASSFVRMEKAAGKPNPPVIKRGSSIIDIYADSSQIRKVDSPYEIKCHGLDLDINLTNPSLPDLAGNLDSRPNFLNSRITAPDYGWLTGVNPTDWTASRSAIENQTPFLVLGHTPQGGAGFRNHSLELNLWLPDSFALQNLVLETANLCDNTGWDTEGSNASFSVHLEGAGGRKVDLLPNENTCWKTQLDLSGINISQIRPIGVPRNLISSSGEQLYRRYKVVAEIDVVDDKDGYSNQFRIDVQTPADGYLGLGKTSGGAGGDYNPETALSTSSRLPPRYNSLEALWETNFYLAADAAKGCTGKELQKIGFYDSDYLENKTNNPKVTPGTVWGHYDSIGKSMKPTIDIYEAPRDLFLQNLSSFPPTSVATLEFDGLENGVNVSHNDWEYGEFEFEFDKVYRLHLRNIHQLTWIQIGLPYDQVNALQKCLDKPQFKIYHAGVSVGGRFGSGTSISTCRDDKLSLPSPAPALYAHADEGDEGSSSEFGAYVRGEINAFYSGFERSRPPPDPVNRLTFANDGNPPWSGNWGGRLRCLPNYWRRAAQLTADTTTSSLDLADTTLVNDNSELLYQPPASGRLELTNGGLPAHLNIKATIYVDGDLHITDNILNENFNRRQFNNLKSLYSDRQGRHID